MSDKAKKDYDRLIDLFTIALPEAIDIFIISDDGTSLQQEGLIINPLPIILYGTLAKEVEQTLGIASLVTETYLEEKITKEVTECHQRSVGYIPHRKNLELHSITAYSYTNVLLGLAMQEQIEEDIRFKTAVLGMNGLLKFKEYAPGQYQGIPVCISEK